MTNKFKLCLDADCTRSGVVSRKNLEEYFERLAWI